jgi:hypothetical protein
VRALTLLTSGLMLFIGVAIVVRTIEAGGGPGALGILLGIAFIAAGAGRLWATDALKRHSDEEEDDR